MTLTMTDLSSISAINKVLQSEAENRDRIDSCRRQAEQLIQNARSRTRRINSRIDTQISTVHQRADAGISKCLTGLKLEMDSLSREPELTENDYLQLYAVIEILVDEMVGDDS